MLSKCYSKVNNEIVKKSEKTNVKYITKYFKIGKFCKLSEYMYGLWFFALIFI